MKIIKIFALAVLFFGSTVQLQAKQEFLILLTSGDCVYSDELPELLQDILIDNHIDNYRVVLDGNKALESYVLAKYKQTTKWSRSRREFKKYFSGIAKSRFVLVNNGKVIYDELLAEAIESSQTWLELYWEIVQLEIVPKSTTVWSHSDITRYAGAVPYNYGTKLVIHSPYFKRLTFLSKPDMSEVPVLQQWSQALSINTPLLEKNIKAVYATDDKLHFIFPSSEHPDDSMLLITSDTTFKLLSIAIFPIEFSVDNVRYRLGVNSLVGDVFAIVGDTSMVLKVYNPAILPGSEVDFEEYDFFPSTAVFNIKQQDYSDISFLNVQLPKDRLNSGRGYYNHNLVFESNSSSDHLYVNGIVEVDSFCDKGYSCSLVDFVNLAEKKKVYLISKSKGKSQYFTLHLNKKAGIKLKKEPNQTAHLRDSKTLYTLAYKYLSKKVILSEYAIVY